MFSVITYHIGEFPKKCRIIWLCEKKSVFLQSKLISHGQFSVIPAEGTWDEARQAYCSGDYENAQGVNEVDYCQLNDKEIDCSDAVDIHITSNDNPMLGSSKVNLGSDCMWIIFDIIIPSQVISTTGGVINEAADVDGNGVVDITDVTKLIEMILSTQ